MKLQFSETIKPLLFVAYGLTLLQLIIASAGFIFLQPELPPLDQQLSAKAWIFVFPVISLLINTVHTVLIGLESKRESLLLVLFSRITVIIQVVLFLAVVRIVYITV